MLKKLIFEPRYNVITLDTYKQAIEKNKKFPGRSKTVIKGLLIIKNVRSSIKSIFINIFTNKTIYMY